MDRDGRTIRGTVDGDLWVTGARTALANMRGIDLAVMDSIRQSLSLLETSSMGRRLVPRVNRILNVLLATTQEQYIARANELPVRIVSRDSVDRLGAVTTISEAYAGGKLRVRVLRAEKLESSPPCTFTDEDNVVWSGACATQTEINAAIATYAAMEAEVDQTESDIQSEKIDYCETAQGRTDTTATMLRKERFSPDRPPHVLARDWGSPAH